MFLFQLWIFNIDLSTIVSFLIGILIGAVLICGLYVIFVLASLQDKKFMLKTDNDLSAEAVKQMILDTQHAYRDSNLRQGTSRIGYCYSLCEGLVFGIATKFYPRSKHPLLEISIDETLELTLYVEKRLNDILDRKGIRLLKKMKVSSIVELTTKTTNILDSKAFKVTKEVSGAVNTFKKVINVVNPAWWFKKIVISNTLNLITDKICLILISIVGEETYKIYSRKVFNEEAVIDSNVEDIIEQMGDDINDANNEISHKIETSNSKKIIFKKNYLVPENNVVANFDFSIKDFSFISKPSDDEVLALLAKNSFSRFNTKYMVGDNSVKI